MTSRRAGAMLPVWDDMLKLLPRLANVEIGSVEERGDAVVISARARAGPAV
ncbi:hypothetical protein [Streptacidiphilus carbonis]|uniref:hypothetical protein n=1 Tax=Streptacidiphilus carbonis TaxID=105422 RepID=UPI0013784FBE|nr:hypothetical protein [Streptacidiphilus carbonis]